MITWSRKWLKLSMCAATTGRSAICLTVHDSRIFCSQVNINNWGTAQINIEINIAISLWWKAFDLCIWTKRFFLCINIAYFFVEWSLFLILQNYLIIITEEDLRGFRRFLENSYENNRCQSIPMRNLKENNALGFYTLIAIIYLIFKR